MKSITIWCRERVRVGRKVKVRQLAGSYVNPDAAEVKIFVTACKLEPSGWYSVTGRPIERKKS